MKSPYDVILKPVVTENSMAAIANRQYTFKVATNANKTEIKEAVEKIFNVKVESVNTMNCSGHEKRMGVHVGRRPDWKKAIVKLTEGSKTIEFFEGMM